ncbi:MAG: cysteine hydrolase [Pirellulales bacterium]|nr:cysteine hydrolase [Pirellulales bacterium]
MSSIRFTRRRSAAAALAWAASLAAIAGIGAAEPGEPPATFAYENRLVRVENPRPILADFPEFCEPVVESARFEAPPLVNEAGGNLAVRAWRFSYNARGIIEIPNRLDGRATAIIVVHPWGIDDGQGWNSPEPAGVAFNCTPEKNRAYHLHVEKVLNPLLERLRDRVALVAYSLPGKEDPIRKQIYRSIRGRPTDAERAAGLGELDAKLRGFKYQANPLEAQFQLARERTVADYFRKFPGLDATAKFNGEGFWELPIPVVKGIRQDPDDVVIYDGDGYPPLREFLRAQGVRHVLLTGYATDMCYCRTTAGYENLDPDFNVFLVGDASCATFPANNTPRYATNAALSFASLEHLITQCSWIEAEAQVANQRDDRAVQP